MVLHALGTSLLGNMFASLLEIGKEVLRAGEGKIRAGQEF